MPRIVYPAIGLICLAVVAVEAGQNREAWWAAPSLIVAVLVAGASVSLWIRERGDRGRS